MTDQAPKPLDYSKLPPPPHELYPAWVLAMLWTGICISVVTLLLAGLAWAAWFLW